MTKVLTKDDVRAELKKKAKKVGSRGDLEHQHQVRLFKWAKRVVGQYPRIGLMYAIPNGGYRGGLEGWRLKEEGVKAGMPDIHLPVAVGGYTGLWIEMKTAVGKLSAAQKEVIGELRECGHRVEVCRGYPEAKAVIDDYYKGE